MTLIKVKSRGTDNVTGRKNILYNGAMQIHQRGNTTTASGSSKYFVDRFNVFHNGNQAVANLQQSTDVPSGNGFAKSLLIDVTTAESSVAAGEIAVLRQIMEGYDLQQLQYGASSARPVTLSFWVKSPKAGTHICELWHFTSPVRTQSQSYTVSSANTWEKHSVTFSGDTATALDNDSNYTMAVQWGLFAGTNYTSGTLATSWQNSGDTNRYVGQQNLFDNTSNNFYLTGVQLEVGNSASDFEHRSFGEELSLCQRYYWQFGTGDPNYTPIGAGVAEGSFSNIVMVYPTKMRAAPSIAYQGVQIFDGSTLAGATGLRGGYIGKRSINQQFHHGSLVTGRGVYASLTGTSSYLSFSSEL
mgnify:CR=1 FL=1